MRARLFAGLLALAILAGAGAATQRAGASPAITGYPDSIAALGDSITQAVNSEFLGNNPEHSWATGTSAGVDTYYSRLLAVHPLISGNRYNNAVSGAQMDDLNGQAQQAVAQGAELVAIFMGSNDVCTSSEATMTSIATFQAEFEAAMATLSSGLPDARIAVLTVPDIFNLWAILKDNASARFVWSLFDICQSMLANPLSTDPANVQRRANVRQRNMDFNDVLNSVCAEYVHCKFDDYLSFDTAFTPAHVSTIDYFHPSIAGQALIAQLVWDTAFDWTDTTPPVSDSTGGANSGGASVALSATDNDAVSGIEYHGGGAWAKYHAPLSVATGTFVTWRAVDVNGNIEATHTCRIGGWSWPSGDDDCDGWSGDDEDNIGTDAGVDCDNATGLPDWPPDFNDDKTVNILDVLQLKPVFGSPSARHDLNVSGGDINILDVLQLKPVFNESCT